MTLTRSSTALRGGVRFQQHGTSRTARSAFYTHEPVRVTDPRYRSMRWRKLRLRILARDAYRCRIVPDCPRPANVCDHIEPVHDEMPDSLFFDPRNLRAACKRHNLRRGHVAAFEREMAGAG
jgi:5-methylcytosine-specific restriction endonuclease McrA